MAVMLYKQKKSEVEIAGIIGVCRATVYRYLEEMGKNEICKVLKINKLQILFYFRPKW